MRDHLHYLWAIPTVVALGCCLWYALSGRLRRDDLDPRNEASGWGTGGPPSDE